MAAKDGVPTLLAALFPTAKGNRPQRIAQRVSPTTTVWVITSKVRGALPDSVLPTETLGVFAVHPGFLCAFPSSKNVTYGVETEFYGSVHVSSARQDPLLELVGRIVSADDPAPSDLGERHDHYLYAKKS